MRIALYYLSELHESIPRSDWVVLESGSYHFGLHDPDAINRVTVDRVERQTAR